MSPCCMVHKFAASEAARQDVLQRSLLKAAYTGDKQCVCLRPCRCTLNYGSALVHGDQPASSADSILCSRAAAQTCL